jgi:hypothetical protein
VRVGTRVRFEPDVWKPVSNYSVDLSDRTGEVIVLDRSVLAVRLDERIEDLDEWANEAVWVIEDVVVDDEPIPPGEARTVRLAEFLASIAKEVAR